MVRVRVTVRVTVTVRVKVRIRGRVRIWAASPACRIWRLEAGCAMNLFNRLG